MVIIEESQQVKNRNLSWLIANLSRQNWPSECNNDFFFVVVTLLRLQEVLDFNKIQEKSQPILETKRFASLTQKHDVLRATE